jgi:hypothetical protein
MSRGLTILLVINVAWLMPELGEYLAAMRQQIR